MAGDVTRREFENLRKLVGDHDRSNGCVVFVLVVLAAVAFCVVMNTVDARLSALEAAQAAKEEAR